MMPVGKTHIRPDIAKWLGLVRTGGWAALAGVVLIGV
jgi:hypothetical protein